MTIWGRRSPAIGRTTARGQEQKPPPPPPARAYGLADAKRRKSLGRNARRRQAMILPPCLAIASPNSSGRGSIWAGRAPSTGEKRPARAGTVKKPMTDRTARRAALGRRRRRPGRVRRGGRRRTTKRRLRTAAPGDSRRLARRPGGAISGRGRPPARRDRPHRRLRAFDRLRPQTVPVLRPAPPAQCGQINGQIGRMRANLDELQSRAGGGAAGAAS